MKVELHLHTSRYSGCAVNTPQELMAQLVACGYEAVFVTEHDSFWPDEQLAELRSQFPQLRIFPGVELTIGDLWSMQHLLVLGTTDPEYAALASGIGRRPDVAGILQKARDEGHLTVLAHPCRWEDGAAMIDAGLLPDALEHHTCNQGGDQAAAALRLAGKVGLPVVNAGDVHSVEMVGRYWIETRAPIDDAGAVRRVVLAGEYENCLE